MIGRAASVGAALALAASVSAQAPIFRSAVDSVTVDVSVQQGGHSVPGLMARDFELLDNGQVQALVDVAYESWPIDITVMTDLSGSVEGALLVSLKRAVDRIAGALRPTDRVHLVGFNHVITESPEQARGGVGLSSTLVAPGGGTSLFDAIVASSIRPRDPAYRQMLIVFTDGEDTMSFVDEKTVIDVARRAGMTIFVVAVTDGARSGTLPNSAPHENMFNAITLTTGGLLSVMPRDQDLAPAFLRAFEDFRTSYVLRYAFQGKSQPGWHDIAVRVTRPGHFDVRARRGYFASDRGGP